MSPAPGASRGRRDSLPTGVPSRTGRREGSSNPVPTRTGRGQGGPQQKKKGGKTVLGHGFFKNDGV